MKKIILSLVATSLIVLPGLAIAIDIGGPVGDVPTEEQAVYDTFNAIINWAFGILLLFAAIMIILAGYTFLTAAGDPEKTTKARNYVLYALIGIVVGFLAKAIVILVGNMLDVDTGGIFG